jgi:hypothetical protein
VASRPRLRDIAHASAHLAAPPPLGQFPGMPKPPLREDGKHGAGATKLMQLAKRQIADQLGATAKVPARHVNQLLIVRRHASLRSPLSWPLGNELAADHPTTTMRDGDWEGRSIYAADQPTPSSPERIDDLFLLRGSAPAPSRAFPPPTPVPDINIELDARVPQSGRRGGTLLFSAVIIIRDV